MTILQFQQIVGIIKSGWGNTRFLDNEDIANSLFNSLNRYPFQLCKDTIIDMIQYGKYEEGVSMSKILTEVESAYAHSKEESVQTQFRNGFRCPVCRDLGYTLHRYPTGVETMTPCDCPVGRLKYPWYFVTPEERKEWEDEEKKKGRNPVKAWRCKPEEYRRAYYGDDPEREAKNA